MQCIPWTSPEEGNASSSEKVNKLNQASWFWLLLPLSYFPLDEPQDVMKPLWYVRSQFFVSQHVFQSWHTNVFWQTFELLPLWCDDPQPPLAGHQVVVQRLQQWCAEAAAQFAERSLEEELQVKPKARGWKSWMWLKLSAGNYCIYIYTYIIWLFGCFFSWCEIVDVLKKSRLYCRFGRLQAQFGGVPSFRLLQMHRWNSDRNSVMLEFDLCDKGVPTGFDWIWWNPQEQQMVRLQSHGFCHGLWCQFPLMYVYQSSWAVPAGLCKHFLVADGGQWLAACNGVVGTRPLSKRIRFANPPFCLQIFYVSRVQGDKL